MPDMGCMVWDPCQTHRHLCRFTHVIHKTAKCVSITSTHHFWPMAIAPSTSGPWQWRHLASSTMKRRNSYNRLDTDVPKWLAILGPTNIGSHSDAT